MVVFDGGILILDDLFDTQNINEKYEGKSQSSRCRLQSENKFLQGYMIIVQGAQRSKIPD